MTSKWRAWLTARAAAAPRPPNVVVILADDLGYGDVSADGGDWIPTPNIDALARSGARFTDGYVTAAVCSPSRAGLLTGRHQSRFGFEFLQWGRPNAAPPPSEVMIPTVMKRAGYATGMIGKWHLGQAPGVQPVDRGFDEYYGVLGGATSYLPKLGPTDEAAITGMDNVITRERDPIYRGREVVHPTAYLTDEFTSQAVSFIQRHRQSPFFLYVAYNAPHVPLQATAKYLDRFKSVKEPYRRVYAAMVSALDDGVGNILKELDESGLRDNTVVIFLSDNGCASYVHGACSNTPLAGYKEDPWEGGIRIPYMVSWPGHVTPGVYRFPVSSLDILPTAAGLAHVQTPATAEGVNLMPYIGRDARSAPPRKLYWRMGTSHVVRDGRWKLLIVKRAAPGAGAKPGAAAAPAPSASPPAGPYTLLYDVVGDPGEQHDVAAAHPDIVRRLKAEFAAWDRRNVAPMFPGRANTAEINGYRVELIN
jgi:arylsulfatase A-like enzyme